MMNDNRFVRTQALLGAEGMARLKQATVMIVGLGAVGGYALEAVARSGVGRLILVDFDRFDISNINRQILALDPTIGEKKTIVAARRVKEINPQCEVILKDMFVSHENIAMLLEAKPDYVIDAIDSLEAKCDLMEALQRGHVPFVSSMGAALKTDASRIQLSKLSETRNCPMARRVRQKLKKCGVNIDEINCVFSSEQCILPEGAIRFSPDDGKKFLGSLPTITAIFGLMIANKVIQDLVKENSNAENA